MKALWKTGNSGNNSELVTSLPMGDVKKVIYSLDLNTGDSIQINDELVANASFEVTTNETVYNTKCAKQLILATSAAATTGTEISEPDAKNVTPDVHHDVHNAQGTISISDTSKHYLNLVAWADSSSGTQALVVEQDYGRLNYQIFRDIPDSLVPDPTGEDGKVLIAAGDTYQLADLPAGGIVPVEGDFTPTVVGATTAGTATYTTQIGKYQRVGNLVKYSLRVVWSGHTGTGSMRIGGLPYASASGLHYAASNYQSSVAVGSGLQFSALEIGGQSYISLYSNNPAGGAALLAMDAAGDIILSGHYFV